MKNTAIKQVLRLALMLAVGLSAPRAFAQYSAYPALEAECPNSATGSYRTRQTSITGASGGGYLRSAGNTAANVYNNTSTDSATYTFNLRAGKTYELWVRVNTNNSASDDSWFQSIEDAGGWSTMINVPAGSGWRWIRATALYPMGPGLHTLQLANREDGLNIDKLAILPLGSAAPTGTGPAAYNCAIPLYFETECRKSAYGNYQVDQTSKAGFSGTGYLESPSTDLDPSMSSDEANFSFEAGAAAYNFFFRIHNNSNPATDSWFYRVDDGSWVTMNSTSGLGSGWRWAQGTASVSLTRATHKLTIRKRESGLSLDKLAIVPTSVAGPSGTGVGSAAVNCEPFQTMFDWNVDTVDEYYATHLNYFLTHDMLAHHREWHDKNGLGGQRGLGSGTAFLGSHRAMLNEFKRFALETNGRSYLPISTVGPLIPATLLDSYDAMTASGLLSEYKERRTDTDLTNYGIPAFLTLAGTHHNKWANDTVAVCPEPIIADFPCLATPRVYGKLGDYPDLDSLGQAIAVLPTQYHGKLHSDVGGVMLNSAYSPADPIFYGWHALIDKLVDLWLTTPNGQAWKAAHANHRFLVPGFTDHHIWDNTASP